MVGRMSRFTIIPVHGPIMRGRAIVITRYITGASSLAVPGITVRSTTAIIAGTANIGMAGAGTAAACTPAQDCAEASRAGIAVIMVLGADTGVVLGAAGVKAKR